MFLRTGDILDDQYRIERSLRGGQGTVYLATRIHGREKKTFAIKRPIETGQEHLDAFRREIETHETLRFPGIPKFIEVVHDENDLPHAVFEYIDGDDLARRLSESGHPFDEGQLRDWTNQLLDILCYMQGQRNPVIHGDIKPANIKIDQDGKLWLLDFGLSKNIGTVTVLGQDANREVTIKGYSPGYASPEQLEYKKATLRSDIYSVGATLFKLATNTAPILATERRDQIREGNPDPQVEITDLNKAISPSFSSFVSQCLRLAPGERPATAMVARALVSVTGNPFSGTETVQTLQPGIKEFAGEVTILEPTLNTGPRSLPGGVQSGPGSEGLTPIPKLPFPQPSIASPQIHTSSGRLPERPLFGTMDRLGGNGEKASAGFGGGRKSNGFPTRWTVLAGLGGVVFALICGVFLFRSFGSDSPSIAAKGLGSAQTTVESPTANNSAPAKPVEPVVNPETANSKPEEADSPKDKSRPETTETKPSQMVEPPASSGQNRWKTGSEDPAVSRPSSEPRSRSRYEPDSAPAGMVGGYPGGVPGGVPGGLPGRYSNNGGTSPASDSQQSTEVVRKSEGFLRGNALYRAVPEYPPIAKTTHVQGDVVVEILIDENGQVVRARAVSGPALLQQAAVGAAKKWLFPRMSLNGKPVMVAGAITFRFSLGPNY